MDERDQPDTGRTSYSPLQDYPMQLLLLEQQNKRREELYQQQNSAPELDPYDAAHYPSRIVQLEAMNRKRLLEARAQALEASERPSTKTPAQQSDGNDQIGAQKRKRSGNADPRLTHSSGIPLGTISGATSVGANANGVSDRDRMQLPPGFDLVYRVDCDHNDPNGHPATIFQDVSVPNASWLTKPRGNSPERSHLNGPTPIFDLEAYINDDTSDKAFIVVRTIECSDASTSLARAGLPLRSTDKIYAKSRTSKSALQKVAMCHFQLESNHESNSCGVSDKRSRFLEAVSSQIEITPLKLFLFHHRSPLSRYIDENPMSKDPIAGLLLYTETQYGNEFKEADTLFAQGLVTQEHILKLYRPNDLVVGEIDGLPSAFVVYDWPQVGQRNWTTLKCWSFQTDGYGFSRKLMVISIPPIEAGSREISSLAVHPMRFAKPVTQEVIRETGRRRWNSRIATHVMYKGWDVDHEEDYPGSRFMIDHGTYHKMHEQAAAFTFDKVDHIYSHDTMPSYLNPEDQPSQTLLCLLPPTTYGYDLHEKRWVHLQLDSVHPISWDTKAYGRLALPLHAKELLHNLTLAQKSHCGIDSGKSIARTRTDIIGGKGNGLTVLLYGGPGTGKTLIAQSIAELAEMPLYRMSCGDIERTANAIEDELAFILRFGKVWNCVLLIEEAHIFLEAHSTPDPKKDSLTSTFLRILESHNGIVILTSSRIVALDNAITSRIQVPLRCGPLNYSSRKQIWGNFIDFLEEDRGKANFEQIRLHLDDLAGMELNGHQIHNAFKTAKDLSAIRLEHLQWDHLVQALSLFSDFATPSEM